MENPNSSSVHTISPTLGVMRNEPPEAAVTGAGIATSAPRRGGARPRPRRTGPPPRSDAEPLDLGDLVTHLRLAGHRLDDLAEDDPDADAGTDGTQSASDPD